MLVRVNPRTMRASPAANALTEEMRKRVLSPINFASPTPRDRIVAVVDWTSLAPEVVRTMPSTRVLFVFASGHVSVCKANIIGKLNVVDRRIHDISTDSINMECDPADSVTVADAAGVALTPTHAVANPALDFVYVGTREGLVIPLKFVLDDDKIVVKTDAVAPLQGPCPVQALAAHPTGRVLSVACDSTAQLSGKVYTVRVVYPTDVGVVSTRLDQDVGSLVFATNMPTADYRTLDSYDVNQNVEFQFGPITGNVETMPRYHAVDLDALSVSSMAYTSDGLQLAVLCTVRSTLITDGAPMIVFLREIEEVSPDKFIPEAGFMLNSLGHAVSVNFKLPFGHWDPIDELNESPYCFLYSENSGTRFFEPEFSGANQEGMIISSKFIDNLSEADGFSFFKFVNVSWVATVPEYNGFVVKATIQLPSQVVAGASGPSLMCGATRRQDDYTSSNWYANEFSTDLGVSLLASTHVAMISRVFPRIIVPSSGVAPSRIALQIYSVSPSAVVSAIPAFASTLMLQFQLDTPSKFVQLYSVRVVDASSSLQANCSVNSVSNESAFVGITTGNVLSTEFNLNCKMGTTIAAPVVLELTPWIGASANGHATEMPFYSTPFSVLPTFSLRPVVRVGTLIDENPTTFPAQSWVDMQLFFDVPMVETTAISLSINVSLAGTGNPTCVFRSSYSGAGPADTLSISIPLTANVKSGDVVAQVMCSKASTKVVTVEYSVAPEAGYTGTPHDGCTVTGSIHISHDSATGLPFELEIGGAQPVQTLTMLASPELPNATSATISLLRNGLPLSVPCVLSSTSDMSNASRSLTLSGFVSELSFYMKCTNGVTIEDNTVLSLSIDASGYNIVTEYTMRVFFNVDWQMLPVTYGGPELSAITPYTPFYIELLTAEYTTVQTTTVVFGNNQNSESCAYLLATDSSLVAQVAQLKNGSDFDQAINNGLLVKEFEATFALGSTTPRRLVVGVCSERIITGASLKGSLTENINFSIRRTRGALVYSGVQTNVELKKKLSPFMRILDFNTPVRTIGIDAAMQPDSPRYQFAEQSTMQLSADWWLPQISGITYSALQASFVISGGGTSCSFVWGDGQGNNVSFNSSQLTGVTHYSRAFRVVCTSLVKDIAIEARIIATIGGTAFTQLMQGFHLGIDGFMELELVGYGSAANANATITVLSGVENLMSVSVTPALMSDAVLVVEIIDNSGAECSVTGGDTSGGSVNFLVANGKTQFELVCQSPSPLPAQLILTVSSTEQVVSYQPLLSSRFQIQGAMNFFFDEVPFDSLPSTMRLVSGHTYHVTGGFVQEPKEPQVITVTYETNPADCVFILESGSTRTTTYTRTAVFTQISTDEMFDATMTCRRTHSIGSIITFASAAYVSVILQQIPVYGLIAVDYRRADSTKVTYTEVTDLPARDTLSLSAASSGAELLPWPVLLSPTTNNTALMRVRLLPTASMMTSVRLSFLTTAGMCGFTTYSATGARLFSTTLSLIFVLGDTQQEVLPSCQYPSRDPIVMYVEIASGNVHLPVVTVPLLSQGTVVFTTEHVANALTGEMTAGRDWAFSLRLDPVATEDTTITIAVGRKTNNSFTPDDCSIRLASSETLWVDLVYGPFEFDFTSTTLTVDFVLNCLTWIPSLPSVLYVTNPSNGWYGAFQSGPFLVRGAMWIEDYAAEPLPTIPSLTSAATLTRVPVDASYVARVRFQPAVMGADGGMGFTFSVSQDSTCNVTSLTHLEDGTPGLYVENGVSEVTIALLCTTFLSQTTLTISPLDGVFYSPYTTPPFSVENRFAVTVVAVHVLEAFKIPVTFLPQNAIVGLGQFVRYRVSVDSNYTQCLGALVGAAESDPAPAVTNSTAWKSLTNGGYLEVAALHTTSSAFWLQCQVKTHSQSGELDDGAVMPRFVINRVNGTSFMSFTSDPFSVSLIDCGFFGQSDNRTVSYQDNGFGMTHYKATATFVCDGGYDLVTTDTPACTTNNAMSPPVTTCALTATCTAAGWSVQAPTCSVHDCGTVPPAFAGVGTSPVQVRSGTTSSANNGSTTFGAVYQYGCLSGFDLATSTSELSCTAGGWSSLTAPACLAVECSTLALANNVGTITYSEQPYGLRKYLSVATHECAALYERTDGDLKRQCQANRTWSGVAPICRSNTCVRLYNDATTMQAITFMRDGVKVTADVSGTYLTGTIAQYACADGYVWENADAVTARTCVMAQGWLPTETPRCVPRPCPALQTVSLGLVVQSPASMLNMYGTTATFSCEYGAVLSHSDPSIICEASGQWSSDPRTCQPYSCGIPGAVTYATISISNAGQHGLKGNYLNTSRVEYRCNVGYNLRYTGYSLGDGTGYVQQALQQGVMVPVAQRECTPNGWIPSTLPICEVNQCSVLTVPDNGASISYTDALSTSNNGLVQRSYGTVATYSCNLGYEPRDAATDARTNGTLRCGILTENWIPSVAPVCGAIDCGAITTNALYAADVTYEFNEITMAGPTRYQATAVYQCLPGFALPGGANVFTRTCSASRTWVPAQPECVDVDECDPSIYGGRFFVDCATLYGPKSRCTNTFGSFVCSPVITLDVEPSFVTTTYGEIKYNDTSREIVPSSTAGGQIITFSVNAGANIAPPYITRVQYSNPDVTIYTNSLLLLYECRDVQVTPVIKAGEIKTFAVECTLSAGQGTDLYLKLQYCIQSNAYVNSNNTVSCSTWNWGWTGTYDQADAAHRNDNNGLRISYPKHYFVPSTLHSITVAGPGQRTNDYVSASNIGEDIGLDVENLFLEREELINITYGKGTTPEDYPHVCTYNLAMSLDYSSSRRTIVCRTKDNVDDVDLKFRLILANRVAYGTDMYSYPQMPTIESVYGCPQDDLVARNTHNCPTDSGDVRLTIAGTGFLEPLSALVSGRQCTDINRISNMLFDCKLPVGTGSSLSLIVKAGSQRFESRSRISYALPTITLIRGCERVSDTAIRECNRQGGDRIMLIGDNFGQTGATISIGGLTCTNPIHSTSNPHREITCTTPGDASVDRPVTLLQRYGELSRNSILLSYVQCPPGFRGEDVTCVPCETGNFNDMWSQLACRQCQPGYYTNTTQSTTCSSCPVGTYSGLGQTECKRCPRGTFSQERAESCYQCAPGTYAAQEGSAQCEACPLGAEHTSDYSYCQCKAGSYMDATRVCRTCMLGGDCSQPGTSVYNVKSLPGYAPSVTLQKRDGVVRIVAPVAVDDSGVDGGSANNDDGRRSAQSKVIKILFDNASRPRERFTFISVTTKLISRHNSSAAFVTAGLDTSSYGTAAGNSTDEDTDPDTVVLMHLVTIDLTPPAFSSEPPASVVAADALEALNAYTTLEGKINLGAVTAMIHPEYTRFATTSFEVCLAKSCLGASQCIEGHGGPLCTVCLPGYGKTSTFVCARCNEPALRWFYLILAGLGGIIGCAILAWKQIVDGRQSMNELPAPAVPLLFKIAMSGLQVMSIATRYDLRWPGFLSTMFDSADTVSGVGTAIVSLDCFLGDEPAVNPFWVTSIGIMVLPILGILLPVSFFAPRYLVAKRQYKKHVLAEFSEQRQLLSQMVSDYEEYLRSRERVTAAKRRRDVLVAAERDHRTLIWENVNDRDSMGLITQLADTHKAIDDKRGNADIDINRKDGYNAAAVYAKRVVGKRRMLRVRAQKEATAGATVKPQPSTSARSVNNTATNSPRLAPLAPPEKPYNPAAPATFADFAGVRSSSAAFTAGSATASPVLNAHALAQATRRRNSVVQARERSPNASPLQPSGSSGNLGNALSSSRRSFGGGDSNAFFGPSTCNSGHFPLSLRQHVSRHNARAASPNITPATSHVASNAVQRGSVRSLSPSHVSKLKLDSPNASAKHCAATDSDDDCHLEYSISHFQGRVTAAHDGDDSSSSGNSDSSHLSASSHNSRRGAASRSRNSSHRDSPAVATLPNVLTLDASTRRRMSRKSARTTGDANSFVSLSTARKPAAMFVATFDNTADDVAETSQVQHLAFDHNDLLDSSDDKADDDHSTGGTTHSYDDSRSARMTSHDITSCDGKMSRYPSSLESHDDDAHSSELGTSSTLGSSSVASAEMREATALYDSVADDIAASIYAETNGHEQAGTDKLRSSDSVTKRIVDDSVFAFQLEVLDSATVTEVALMHAFARVREDKTEAFARTAREVEVYSQIVRETPEFSEAQRDKLIAASKTTEAMSRVVQSQEDLEIMRVLAQQTFEAMYEAEQLRERVLRREREFQKERAEQQLAWYVLNYGDKKGTKQFETERAKRLKAEPPQLTASEMRVRLDVAETQYNQASSEYLGYIITAITVVMFMIHPNITRQFFTILSCKNVGGSDDPSARVVLGEMTERCFSSQHIFFIFVLGVPMLIMWVIGIPFFAWIVLFRNRDLITMPAQGASAVTRNQKRIFESQMAFLYRGYKPTRYYWFLNEMVRKALLVAIAVFFPGSLHTQLLMASLLIFVCILMQILARPFENKIPEIVEFLSLFSSFMVFFLANFLFVDTVSEESKTVVTVFIILVVLLFCVSVVAGFFYLTKEESKLTSLRTALRAAHAQGQDTAPVIREWRIKRARERRFKLAEREGSVAAVTNATSGSPNDDGCTTLKSVQSASAAAATAQSRDIEDGWGADGDAARNSGVTSLFTLTRSSRNEKLRGASAAIRDDARDATLFASFAPAPGVAGGDAVIGDLGLNAAQRGLQLVTLLDAGSDIQTSVSTDPIYVNARSQRIGADGAADNVAGDDAVKLFTETLANHVMARSMTDKRQFALDLTHRHVNSDIARRETFEALDDDATDVDAPSRQNM